MTKYLYGTKQLDFLSGYQLKTKWLTRKDNLGSLDGWCILNKLPSVSQITQPLCSKIS